VERKETARTFADRAAEEHCQLGTGWVSNGGPDAQVTSLSSARCASKAQREDRRNPIDLADFLPIDGLYSEECRSVLKN